MTGKVTSVGLLPLFVFYNVLIMLYCLIVLLCEGVFFYVILFLRVIFFILYVAAFWRNKR